MLPPEAPLQVHLTIDGAEAPVQEAELHLQVDDTTLGSDGRWAKATHPEVQLLLSLRFDDAGSGLIARIPPQHLGLPIPPDEDPPEFALVLQPAAAPRSQRPKGLIGQAGVGPRGIWAELQGTLPDGRPLRLAIAGIPSALQATVVEAQGSAAAAAWLDQLRGALHLDDAGETTEVDRGSDGDKTLLQRWSPAAWGALHAAQRGEAQRREAPSQEAPRQSRPPPGPAPLPTPEHPLVAGQRAYRLRRGEVQLNLQNQGSATQLALQLELVVDEHSGEDGALAPSLEATLGPLPFALPLGGAWSIVSPAAAAIEAWYGNDAPELFTTDLRWRLLGDRARLKWRATYEDWETGEPAALEFEGELDFGGLWLEGPGDLQALLAAGLDPEARAALALGPLEITGEGRWRAKAQLRGSSKGGA